MESYIEEIEQNFERFYNSIALSITDSRNRLSSEKELYLKSYKRITSLNAWRTTVLSSYISSNSVAFFLEAQNDALISHVSAQHGLWRVALQALRSCIENVLCTLYYMDHPVELSLWQSEDFKIGFTELYNYFSKHPSFRPFKGNLNGLEGIKKEYSTLSQAVHASAVQFRMTQGNEITIWNPDPVKLRQWSNHEKACLSAINCILVTSFRDRISGSAYLELRKSISLCISENTRSEIKKSYNVNIPDLSSATEI